MPMALVEARFLDPRPADEARERPIANSVNIPLESLRSRVWELPAPFVTVEVAGPREVANSALEILRGLGRRAVVAQEFSFGASGGGRLWRPNQFLAGVAQRLPTGRALDLGAGQGRDAVFLADLGSEVTAVDKLQSSAARGRELERRYLGTEAIDWWTADVLAPGFEAGQFDLVVELFFFDRELFLRSVSWLAHGGSVVVEAFTSVHQGAVGKPASPDRVVRPGELLELAHGLEVVAYEEGEHPKGHTARLWARKP